VELDLPPVHFETVGIWIEIPDKIKEATKNAQLHFMGGIHALEHAAISMFPLFALCDRDDIGGISTPQHEQVCRAAVFIYDGHPGGVGLAHRAFDVIDELLHKTRALVASCPCEDGCPSCIHSPKCASENKPLDKQACLLILDLLFNPQELETMVAKKNAAPQPSMLLFPDEPDDKFARYSRNANTPENKKKKVVVFDLETQKLADEVGGWKNISKMKLSLGVAYTEEDGFLTFTEDNVLDLVALLKSVDLVVGFNHIRFDYEVLRAYTTENLKGLTNLDILLHVQDALGHRLKLDQLAEATLGANKAGNGLDATAWFRDGRMDLLEQYCREDVRITRDLYRFGCDNGFLLYRPRDRGVAKIQVRW
jgi:DEAD/DEAH box helicase domain-containing protein